VSAIANVMKGNLTDDQFLEVCQKVVRTISSQALPKGIEGSTTISKESTGKAPRKRATPNRVKA